MKQNVCTVGINLAKNLFHLVRTDITGKMVLNPLSKNLRERVQQPIVATEPFSMPDAEVDVFGRSC